MMLRWDVGGAVEAPAPGVVHVWAIALDVPRERLARLGATLSRDERARAARFRSPALRARFTAARGATRELLGRCLGVPPARVRFAYDGSGKPSIASPRVAPPLDFNLSHADGLALLAVSAGGPVGVDVERLVERADLEGVARRFLAPAERAELAAAPAAQRTAAFYRCWTRKEAYLKARGLGLLAPLDGVDVSIDPLRPALRRDDADAGAPCRWALAHLEPADGFVGALAVERPRARVRCRAWPG